MAKTVIETTDITKRYDETLALDGVSLSVRRGSVYGLIGPNGAGKTTLLGVLAGLRTPTEGSFTVGASRVAVLPDTPKFDPWMKAREVVELSRNLTLPEADSTAVDAVLDRTGLLDVAQRRVGGFSRGMLQRLGLAAAVVGNPDLLLLDEPAAALDPAGRREVLDLVKDVRGDSTVVFSSHILDDVEEVCDEIGILNRGRLVYEGTLEALVRGSGLRPSYQIRVRGSGDRVVDALRVCDWVTDVSIEGASVIVSAGSAAVIERELVRCLARIDAVVISVAPVERTLEDVFLEVTR
ncbi:MAG: ABC transporter ATP-binding protein [Actinomycetota bacterium]|nr:ABC transporter ATP-binding protein [Actinomycetota bacterium]